MAKIMIDGRTIYSEITCIKDLDGWEPDGPIEFEFELNIDDIEFDDEDIEEFVEEYLDKVVDYVVKKHANKVAQALKVVKAGGGS